MQDPDKALKVTRVTFDVATSDTKIQLVPQERIQVRIIEEILEVPVSQVTEEAGRVVKHVSQESVHFNTAEPVDVVNVIPQERVR